MDNQKKNIKFYFFIKKIREYDPGIVKYIENILVLPKFKMGNFFRTIIPYNKINLNREYKVYHIDKMVINLKQ